MPDDRTTQFSPPPHGWGEALAALPLETPAAGGWEALGERIPRERTPAPRHARWPAWCAMAAALALAAVLPWRLAVQNASVPPIADGRQDTADPPRAPQPPVVVADDNMRSPDTATAMRETPPATQAAAREPAPSPASVAATGRDVSRTRSGSGPRTPTATRAARDTAQPVATETRVADGTSPELERLYAESAQLEALLSLARDDRVASGTAAALSSDFDSQVASIDAALTRPGVSQPERAALWRDRVDALRQSAGFESTRRLLAAEGERYDGMLVSID